ncbi:hypothetical protein GpartN1_g6429.t1 [Galdieria partita]|uniref:Archaeal ATPase n=1 Tax=Galdieria partita TaxID=83374 RepID=A0A9C7Q1A6_9RHOD|nr:hypothetical protein GpartN1_g6429.t1 [Galdieria partita]
MTNHRLLCNLTKPFEGCFESLNMFRVIEPQIDREEDVKAIIETFLSQFTTTEYGGTLLTRPACCFAPHIYGAGKTFLGQQFLAYLNIFAQRERSNEEVFQQLDTCSDASLQSAPQISWKHFAENTLSVVLKLGSSFPDAPYPEFRKALSFNIAWAAAEDNGKTTNETVRFTDATMEQPTLSAFIGYLLQHFQKQYLFLMIDELSEISALSKHYGELTEMQVEEHDPKYVPFRNFFREIRPFLDTGKVILYLAGRTAEISAHLSDARSSKVVLRMLQLNPFNLKNIEDYLNLFIYGGKKLKDWFLCSDDLQDRFVELLKRKTGGIPLILKNTLLALLAKVKTVAYPIINDSNMESLLDSVFRDVERYSATFIVPERVDSSTLLRYQFVLLNHQLGTIFPNNFAITLCGTKTYLIDLVASFGFYSEFIETEVVGSNSQFKIGCCEFILKAHSENPFLREVTKLLPLSNFGYISDPSMVKGVFFEFVFMNIFRFRLLTSLYSNSSCIVHSAIPGIFKGSLIEHDNVSYSKESTVPYTLPILKDVSFTFDDYYRKHLQHCGIFIPKDSNSSGPDAYFVLQNGQTRYVVGFQFKFYYESELSRRHVDKEADKFFKGVVKVLNNLPCSPIQLCFQFVVVCTHYDQSVLFLDNESNIVEDINYLTNENVSQSNEATSRSLLRLQLVIVSQSNLEQFLGKENVEALNKIRVASRGEFREEFSEWCRSIFESMSNEHISRVRSIADTNLMEVEDITDEENVVASSSMSSSFDWNTFLRERCGLSEEECSVCYSKVSRLGRISLSRLNEDSVLKIGIKDPSIISKLLIGITKEFN